MKTKILVALLAAAAFGMTACDKKEGGDATGSGTAKAAASGGGDKAAGGGTLKECDDARAAIKACKGPAAEAGKAGWEQGVAAAEEAYKANASGPGATMAADAAKQACKAVADSLKAACQ
ncbi:MAG: hypothetical protein HY908_16770 [Myxococcales bacterium]|nr:hypothetical protein [Myxococcales bacterium]